MRPTHSLNATAGILSGLIVCGLGTVRGFGPPAAEVTITEFSVPTSVAAPTGITSAPDGSVWFTEQRANKVARMTTSGTFTEYPIPTPASGPQGITTTPDGEVWFTERYGGKIGRISESGGPVAEFVVPGYGAFPTAITMDGTGRVWFASSQQPGTARIGWISSTGVITLLASGATRTTITALVAGPDGNLWVTEVSSYFRTPLPRRRALRMVRTAGSGSLSRAPTGSGGLRPRGSSPSLVSPPAAGRSGSRPDRMGTCGSPSGVPTESER